MFTTSIFKSVYTHSLLKHQSRQVFNINKLYLRVQNWSWRDSSVVKPLPVPWWKCTAIVNPWNSVKAICILHVCNPRTPTRQRGRKITKGSWAYVTEGEAWKVERGERQKEKERMQLRSCLKQYGMKKPIP